VGPAKPTQVLSGGEWPFGRSYAKGLQCRTLGIADNLAGKCEPVCGTDRCLDKEVGFLLKNPFGLRFGELSFDTARMSAGQNYPRNLCALARYGNKGTVAQQASSSSFMSTSDADEAAQPQNFWYGACNTDDEDEKQCCANAKLLQSGFDWKNFAMGTRCDGSRVSSKKSVVTSVTCIYDDAKYAQASSPK